MAQRSEAEHMGQDHVLQARLAEPQQRSPLLDDVVGRQVECFGQTVSLQQVFDQLLAGLVASSGSQLGMIAQVLCDEQGQRFLRLQSFTEADWHPDLQRLARGKTDAFELRSPDTLLAAVLRTGGPVIANDPRHDQRCGELPSEHPRLTCFLGLPIRFQDQLVGVVGLANRPGGYDQQLVELLQPLVLASGAIIAAWRSDEQRRAAAQQLQAAYTNLEHRLDGWCRQQQIWFAEQLHDELGQQLSALGVLVANLQDDVVAGRPVDAGAVNGLARGIEQAIAQVRTMARGLVPVTLDGTDLPAALSQLAARSSRQFGVRCEFRCLQPAKFGAEAVRQLYYIAQEAVRNAVQHGRASAIHIQLAGQDRSQVLEVWDDGVGFDPASPPGDGLGLQLMRHRARSIDAQLVVTSAPGRGTRIRCAVPRHRVDQPDDG